MAASVEWAQAFSDAAIQMVAHDAERVQTLRAKLQPFVAENRSMLKPDGAVGIALIRYRDAYRVFAAQIHHVAELGGCAELMGQDRSASGAITRLLGMLQGWQVSARQLQPWCLWQRVRAKAVSHGLHGLVSSLEADEVPLDDIAEFFEYSYQSWWVKKAIDREPVLCTFSSADHERKIDEFRLADERFQKLSQQYIVAKLSAKFRRVPVSRLVRTPKWENCAESFRNSVSTCPSVSWCITCRRCCRS